MFVPSTAAGNDNVHICIESSVTIHLELDEIESTALASAKTQPETDYSGFPKNPLTSWLETLKITAANCEQWKSC